MRFLKNKIARALQFVQSRQAPVPDCGTFDSLETPTEMDISVPNSPLEDVEKSLRRKRRVSSGNNIMKNYARAFVNFGLSSLALPHISNGDISPEKFQQILKSKRKNANCIKGLRGLLLQERRDSRDMRAFKIIFQKLCEIFMKYYCVNWIFHSRVDDKMKHLSYRGKILRRVKDPEHFTYLEDFVKRKSSAKTI